MFSFTSAGSLWPIVVIDLLCVLGSIAMTKRQLSFQHPFSIYLLFHIYSFTMRAIGLAKGGSLMYEGFAAFEPVTYAEIARAMIWADIAILLFAAGTIFGYKSVYRTYGGKPTVFARPVHTDVSKLILFVCLIIGAFFFVLFRFTSGVEAAEISSDASRNYMMAAAMWPGTCILALCIIRGTIGLWIIPLAGYLLVVGTQGYHRFMLILPCISLIMIYLRQKKRRWPTALASIILIFGFMMFPFLKYIGRGIQERDINFAVELAKASVGLAENTELQTTNEGFLDQYAGFLSMTDDFGELEYGKSYLSAITLPIPRAMWPEKPGLADHMVKRATTTRQYDKEGRIITYLGEAYVNFGILGLLLFPLTLGFLLSRFYEKAFLPDTLVISQLAYLIAAPCLIQVFRDGLNSLILFGVAFNMPLIFVAFINFFTSSKTKFTGKTPHSAIPLRNP